MKSIHFSSIFIFLLAYGLLQIRAQEQKNEAVEKETDEIRTSKNILKILSDTSTQFQEEVMVGITRLTNLKDYHQAAPIFNKFRLSLQNAEKTTSDPLVSSRFIQQKFNSTEIWESLQELHTVLNPNNFKNLGSIVQLWQNQQKAIENEFGGKDKSLKSVTVASWTSTIENFEDFITNQTQWIGQQLNDQISNLTNQIGQDLLAEFSKPEILVPKRQPFSRSNLTTEVIIEREEEEDDFKLKNAKSRLIGPSNTLSKLIVKLEPTETVRGFVQNLMENKDIFSKSKSAVLKLGFLLNAKKDQEILLNETFGANESIFHKEEWMEDLKEAEKFMREKLEAIDQREGDREMWKKTQDFKLVDEERERLDMLRTHIGSYGLECTSSCMKYKDYLWCETASSWDYCSTREWRDYKGNECKDRCDARGYKYKWCNVEGDTWGYCSTFK